MKHDTFVVHVVDPDPAIADGLVTLLSTYGMQVCYYPDAESFLESRPRTCRGHCCLLVDADLPGLSGPALLQRLNNGFAHVPVLLFLSTSSPELIEAARSSSRISVIEKPFVDGMLVEQLLRLQGACG
ncbi:MAG: response regulator [Gammaproteobacteria bacterium]|nr:response regulator [Gammaproteobacteria bacterium]